MRCILQRSPDFRLARAIIAARPISQASLWPLPFVSGVRLLATGTFRQFPLPPGVRTGRAQLAGGGRPLARKVEPRPCCPRCQARRARQMFSFLLMNLGFPGLMSRRLLTEPRMLCQRRWFQQVLTRAERDNAWPGSRRGAESDDEWSHGRGSRNPIPGLERWNAAQPRTCSLARPFGRAILTVVGR